MNTEPLHILAVKMRMAQLPLEPKDFMVKHDLAKRCVKFADEALLAYKKLGAAREIIKVLQGESGRR